MVCTVTYFRSLSLNSNINFRSFQALVTDSANATPMPDSWEVGKFL